MTIEPDGNVWIATQRDKHGNPLLECVLEAAELSCGAVAAD
jgi:hypothetical protein